MLFRSAAEAPTVEDIRRILTRHPDTTILCVSREAAGRVNALCVQALFPRRVPLATVPGDVESLASNYGKDGKLKMVLETMSVPIHVGMQVSTIIAPRAMVCKLRLCMPRWTCVL